MTRFMMLSVLVLILAYNIYSTNAFDNLCDACIPKCCPENQIVYKKNKCVAREKAMVSDISSFPVFTDTIHATGKKLKDYFKLAPRKFSDENFRREVYNVNGVGFNVYLTENRSVFLEKPNAFDRWMQVKPANYCLDFIYPGKDVQVWAQLETDEMEDTVYITVGMIISCVFLVLVLVVYSLLRELRNLCGKVLMAYVFCLLMSFLSLAVILANDLDLKSCIAFAFIGYFFFITTFCWMNIMSYDIWWTFRGYDKVRPIHRRGENYKFCMYCMYGFGVPLGMTILMGVINSLDLRHIPWFVTPNIPESGCFLSGGQKLVYLYVPLLIMNLFNWIFFVMTALNIWRLNRDSAILNSSAAATTAAYLSQRQRLMVYLKLSILMGLNWVLEVVSSFKPQLRVWYITDTYNMLIGLSIFLIFVCKKKIFRRLIEELQRCRDCSRRHFINHSSCSVFSPDATRISFNPNGVA
ncbi:G-protein coupled receptor Mth2-like isoform X2 [Plodia interpunctella]|uniref:G-protein coupled receptor Mth2-like isoform X2 n=1 Tax=Plodia interpunctella TaxID=58824 RepID=UPI002367F2BF|nr:G-protein coupled receptor Mth2-like isoform X1 [Plodia interpunctella]